jgi:hypothetical protein
MERRSKDVLGMVNFPIDSQEYSSTNEGGMFVQLWCFEDDKFSDESVYYGSTYSTMSESLIGTDEEVNTDNFHEIEQGKNFTDWVQSFALEEQLFPNIKKEVDHQYLSKELIACVTLGCTGWSGTNKDHDYWRCEYEDLNEGGKSIYNSLKSAYPKAKLVLVTWLDT